MIENQHTADTIAENDDHIEKDPNEARQGQRIYGMPTVLVLSTTFAAGALFAALLF